MFEKAREVFLIFLRLGMTSFGGPIAHLGYFHAEFVERKKWIEEHAYADLVALCQFLPGPASSQVGIAIGLTRAGYLGAFAAWLGFTLPSALLLVLFALGISQSALDPKWLHGLKVVAVAVVAQAIWTMAVKLCPDKKRASIAIIAACIVAIMPSALSQVLAIVSGAVAGLVFLRDSNILPHTPFRASVSRSVGFVVLLLLAALLLTLPLVSKMTDSPALKVFDSFFRAGSLVFGGGHVVLPLLQAELVPTGLVSKEIFMAGYGATQAVPGPLFTFSAYLGASLNTWPNGWLGAGICLIAAFLPSFLMVIGALPFWEDLRKHARMRYAMLGINAAVVGLLIAAFYSPVWTSAILSVRDFAWALVAFLLLVFWKVKPWLIVMLSAAVGAFLL